MKTFTIKTRPCFYCNLTIDLTNNDFLRIDTLRSVLGKGPKAYSHELCAAQADEEAANDRGMDEYLDDQSEYVGPVYYEELLNEGY